MSATNDDLPDRMRTIASLLIEAASQVETARLHRDCAKAGHEGQTRNTLAFMRERDELADRIAAAIAALDVAPDPASDDATKREAQAILAANRQAHAILTAGRNPESRRRAEDGP